MWIGSPIIEQWVYYVYRDESLREKEESICEVGRVFPRHVQSTYLTGESPLGCPRVAHTLRLYNYLLRFHLIRDGFINKDTKVAFTI